MFPNLRKVTLAVTTASAGFCAWHFWPASSNQPQATLTEAADRPTRGPLDAPTPGASPIPFSQSATNRDGSLPSPSQPDAAPLSAWPDPGTLATAPVPRGTLPNSVGAIKTRKPNRSRPAATMEPANSIAEAPRRRLIIEAIPPAPVPGRPLVAGAAPLSELQIDLAPGVKEPIALVDFTADLSPAQARAVASIANEFVGRIEQAADALSDEDLSEEWDAEQTNADAQYYAIFGAEAYNRKLAETAANAVAGKAVERDAAPAAK